MKHITVHKILFGLILLLVVIPLVLGVLQINHGFALLSGLLIAFVSAPPIITAWVIHDIWVRNNQDSKSINKRYKLVRSLQLLGLVLLALTVGGLTLFALATSHEYAGIFDGLYLVTAWFGIPFGLLFGLGGMILSVLSLRKAKTQALIVAFLLCASPLWLGITGYIAVDHILGPHALASIYQENRTKTFEIENQ